MNAEANGQSSAALRISVTPDPRSPSNWRPAPDGSGHYMQARVRHPDGGERTVADTLTDEKAQQQKITRERDMGSHKHDRLPRWQRWIPKLAALFGFILLLYFFAGGTNVDWQSPVSMNLAFAGVLAAMVTVLSYGFLAFTGYRFRAHKSSEGAPDLHELDGLTKAASGAALAVIAVLAVLMYLGTRREVLDTLGGRAGESALVIPLSVAVVSVVANCLVVLIHAFDGSDEVARLDRLAAATRRPARKAHRLRRPGAQQARR
jgi:hypothetical protein